MKRILSRTLFLALFPALAVAFGTSVAANEAIQERMSEVIPGAEIDAIRETPLEGLFEVRYGTEIFYVSSDGEYLLQGNLIELETRDNLTQQALNGVRAEYFSALTDGELVTYSPNGDTRGVLNIFTDPNCPYCRQIHEDVPKYLEAGIKVRYLQYPVLGRDSPEIMDRIWCSDDRQEAMDRAKAGDKLNDIDGSCTTPQNQHLSLGQQIGIRGTPALISDEGHLVGGYQEAEQVLATMFGQ